VIVNVAFRSSAFEINEALMFDITPLLI